MNVVFGVVKKILGTVLFPLKPIIDPILALGDAMIHVLELLTNIIKLVPKMMSLFEIFTDPGKVIKDAVYGVKMAFLLLWDGTIGAKIGSFTKNFYLGSGDEEKKGKRTKEMF